MCTLIKPATFIYIILKNKSLNSAGKHRSEPQFIDFRKFCRNTSCLCCLIMEVYDCTNFGFYRHFVIY
uniref:Putative ovule protein n=1 Tax=Solanum chacoense TaxID=4108 RepID=A0A0V0GGV2_SOLCH